MILHIACLYLCIVEPLQKLQVRLGACKTGESPKVIFILLIVPRRYFCCISICFMFWGRNFDFVLLEHYVRFQILVCE